MEVASGERISTVLEKGSSGKQPSSKSGALSWSSWLDFVGPESSLLWVSFSLLPLGIKQPFLRVSKRKCCFGQSPKRREPKLVRASSHSQNPFSKARGREVEQSGSKLPGRKTRASDALRAGEGVGKKPGV